MWLTAHTTSAYLTLKVNPARYGRKKRFAVETEVEIKSSGALGVVILCEDTASMLGEYWHTVRTDEGESDHPGSNLEAVTKAQSQKA